MTTKNNNNKILFLWLNDKEFNAVNSIKRGVSVFQTYKRLTYLEKLIRRIQLSFNLPGISIWMNRWKKELYKYKVVIVHASILAPPVVKFIREKDPNIRIIVWYWNPVDKCVDVHKFGNYDCEIWSFDEQDCEKYKLNYNTQYYFKDLILPKKDYDIDIFFVGGDKGRIAELIDLKKRLDEYDISNYFHITPTGKENTKYKDYYSKRISYDEVLMYIASSKVIVDYVSTEQTGLTLRPLESFFYNKKLITNDKSIKNRDFYRKENIFIVGEDDLRMLQRFIYEPYEEIDVEIVNKYDFGSWLGRFNIN